MSDQPVAAPKEVVQFRNILQGGKVITVLGDFKMNKDGLGWRSKEGGSVTVVGSDLAAAKWLRMGRSFQLRLETKNGTTHKFEGFREQDQAQLQECLPRFYHVDLATEELSTKGWNWGLAQTTGNTVAFKVDGKTAFEIPMNEISNIQSSKQEVLMEFHHDDTLDDKVASLTELRFHIPKEEVPEEDGEEQPEDDGRTTADKFVDEILNRADLVSAGGKAILELEVGVAAPRGRYTISMFPGFFKMHGPSRDYKINYSSVVRLFQMPKPDNRYVYFVLSLAQGVRGVGNTSHQHIVMMLPEDDMVEVDLNWPESEQNSDHQQRLGTKQEGPLFEVVARLFKTMTQKKVTIPKGFKNAQGGVAVKCWYGSNEGHLYPFERSFLFVHKPAMYIRFDEISDVEFARVGGDTVKGSTGNRTFDLIISMRQGKPIQFQNLQRSDYAPLLNFLTQKKVHIANFEEMPQPAPSSSVQDDEDAAGDDEEASRRMIASQRRAEATAVDKKERDVEEEEPAAADDGDNIATRRRQRSSAALVQQKMRQEIMSGRGGDDEESEEDNDFQGGAEGEEESEEDDDFDEEGEDDEETPKKKKKRSADDDGDEQKPKKKKAKTESDDE